MAEDRGQRQDNGEQRSGVVTLTVPSQPKYLYVVRSALYPLVLDAGFGRKDAGQIVLAVDEACSNIIKHAYEGDPAQIITVTVIDGRDRLTVRLRDFGKKADARKIAPRDLKDIRPGGLGTHFIRTVFDTMCYDTSVLQGTELILEKLKQQVKT